MENDKENSEALAEKDGEVNTSGAQRARNRTVMLTPDITGEVRARLAQDMGAKDDVSSDSDDIASSFGSPPAFGQPKEPSSEPAFVPFGNLSQSEPSTNQSPPSYGQADDDTPSFLKSSAASNTPTPPKRTATPAANVSGDQIVWVKNGPVIGFLVSFDEDENGEVFPLRTGRLIVTSEAANAGNFLIVNDETVSPMHAILRMTKSGEIQVLDQLSEHGTKIKRFESDEVQELSGDKGTLEHGDTIIFGERKFHVCILLREVEE